MDLFNYCILRVMGGIYKGFQLNFKVFGSESNNTDYDVWESFKLDDIANFNAIKVCL